MIGEKFNLIYICILYQNYTINTGKFLSKNTLFRLDRGNTQKLNQKIKNNGKINFKSRRLQ